VDHCGEAFVGFLVARGDAPERLELTEEVLDKVPPFVHFEVARDASRPIGFWRDDRSGTSLIQFEAQPIDIEGFVSQERIELNIFDQRLDTDAVMTLPRQKDEAHEIAEGIDQCHDLGRQAAARAADGLILSPPLAPVPCWWTRTIVPSMIAYSKSGSPDKLSKILSKTPFNAHRRKRWKTEFQFPNSGWRSRQGEPVRAIQSTASRKRRLSAPERPGSPDLPGSSGAVRSHCASLNTYRSKTGLRFPVLNPISRKRGIPFVNVNRP
jgi:hypothetical protein